MPNFLNGMKITQIWMATGKVIDNLADQQLCIHIPVSLISFFCLSTQEINKACLVGRMLLVK